MEFLIEQGVVYIVSLALFGIVLYLAKCALCWKELRHLDDGTASFKAQLTTRSAKAASQSSEIITLPQPTTYETLEVPQTHGRRPSGPFESPSSRSSSRSTLYQPSIEETIIENVPLEFNVDWSVDRASDLPDVLPAASLSEAPSPDLTRRDMIHMKRSTSVPAMMDSHFKPRLECKVLYNKEMSELKIHDISASDLVFPIGNKTFVFINVSLVPLGMKAFTEAHEITLSPSFTQDIVFAGITEQDIDKAMLYLAVTAASTRKMEKKKGSFIAELPLKLSELSLDDGEQVISRLLNTNRRIKRKSTSDIFLHMELGQLFILLQYQSAANRMKVLIRKATNLPKNKKLPGLPEHFVVINLIRKNFVADAKETKPQRGYNPVWNEPFLFDLPQRDSQHYSLDFIIMSGRKYTKDSVVGHVTVGPDTTRTGSAHWTEAMSPSGVDIAKWHSILPKFQYSS